MACAHAYGWPVRWVTLQILCCLLAACTVRAEPARIVKVLPQYLDQKGRHALRPSLYERDAYQAHLKKHPELCTALRFDVEWKAPGLKEAVVRMEVRGNLKGQPQQAVAEGKTTKGWLSHWNAVLLEGEAFRNLGEITAWRATLWSGGRQLAEQKSFLW